MGIFGWSLPPGCGTLPGEEPDPPCTVCNGLVDCDDERRCICPECPECGRIGDPDCYTEADRAAVDRAPRLRPTHNLVRSSRQIELRAEREAAWAESARQQADAEAKLNDEIERYWREEERLRGRG